MMELLGGLLIATAISGVVPVLNAELLVLAAAAATPLAGLPLVVAVATGGQMFAKTILFALARWLPRKLPKRARAALDRASERVRLHRRGPASLVFASAVSGIPPFYGVSLACGALGLRLRTFVKSLFTVAASSLWAPHGNGGARQSQRCANLGKRAGIVKSTG